MLLKREWGAKSFGQFQAARDPDVVAQDETRLQAIFNLEAFNKPGSIAALALEWARQNDVNFYIDHKATGRAAGYYIEGTGCIALVDTGKLPDPERCVEIMVHEIRHAWQDKHGMISTVVRDFGEAYMRLALLEADATAHGVYAAYHDHTKGNTVRIDRMQYSFMSWYRSFAATYGTKLMNSCNDAFLQKNSTPLSAEMIEVVPYFSKGLDVDHIDSALALGKSFDHTNYLAGPEMRDFLIKKSLNKTSAQQFFQAYGSRLVRDMPALNKQFLKMKRDKGGYIFAI